VISISARWRGWLKWLARLLVVAAVVWGVRHTLSVAIVELDRHRWSAHAGWLTVSAALYLVGLLPSAWFWQRLLWRLGQRPSFFETLRAYYIGHLGKYVPGKALVLVVRAALVSSPRTDPACAVATTVYETMSMMAVGGLVSLVVLIGSGGQSTRLAWAALAMTLAVAVPIVPPVFARAARLLNIERWGAVSSRAIGDLWRELLVWGTLPVAAGWIALGGSFWAVFRALDAERAALSDLPLCVAAVGLALIGGFLSFVPAGAFVREALLMELLAVRFGGATALVAAVMLRIVWLVAEVAISIILYAGGWIRRAPRNFDGP